MGITYKELRKMSDRVLIEWHNKEASYDFTQSECREELSMRRMQRQTTVVLWLTILIAVLTAVVTATPQPACRQFLRLTLTMLSDLWDWIVEFYGG